MSQVFIAHVEEDADVTLEIALGLEEAGFSTWCYEVDSLPGPSYLIQTGQAVATAEVIVVIISPHSLSSRQVTKEVVRAHESGKDFIPILRDITHVEFQNRQPEWREAIGAAASIVIPPDGVEALIPRIINGVKNLGVTPHSISEKTHIVQIRQVLKELPSAAAATTEHDITAESDSQSITETVSIPADSAKDHIKNHQKQLVDDILDPGELIIFETRSSIVSLLARPVFHIIIGVVLIFAIASIITGNVESAPDISENLIWFRYYIGLIVYYIGIIVTVIAIIRLVIRLLRWYSIVFALTNTRLIKQGGLTTRHYLECKVDEIRNVDVKRPLIGRIFDFGNIQISVMNKPSNEMNWEGVPDPLQIQKVIKSSIRSVDHQR